MDHTITHACGHLQIHHVLGFTQQQLRKVAMLEATPCDSCQRAAKREACKAPSKEQAAAVAHLALANLSGSPRQVAWAESIRVSRLTSLLADRENGTTEVCRSCAAIAEARWWIEHRNLPLSDLVARAMGSAMISSEIITAAA